MMNAAIYREFGGPICLEKVPIPNVPLDGVLLQVKATGICRSDWHGWKGHDGDVISHGLPFCPGHEVSGIISQVGPNVTKFNIGDRVAVPFILSCGDCIYCCKFHQPTVCKHQKQPGFTQWGSFAEYVALPRADRNLRHLPDNVTFVQAAALGCRFTTAYRAIVQQGQIQNDDTVAIFGCGGVGLSCIFILSKIFPESSSLKQRKIIAVDVSPHALQKAIELGATHTILATTSTLPSSSSSNDTINNNNNNDLDNKKKIRRRICQLTGEQNGADISIDAAGFASTCENAIWCTRPGGKMIQVGLPIDNHNKPPNVPMGLVAGRELQLIGSHGFDSKDLPDLLNIISQGKLNPEHLVERQVTLDEGCSILQDMNYKSPLGIVMITEFSSRTSSRL